MVNKLSWLYAHLKGHRGAVAVNAVLALLGPVLTLWQVWSLKHVIDVAMQPGGESLLGALALLVAVMVANVLIKNVSIYYHSILDVKLQNMFKLRLFEKILHTQEADASRLHSGDFMSRMLQDLNSIVGLATDTLPNFVSSIILMVGSFSYMCYLNWMIAVAIVVITPLFLVMGQVFMRRLNSFNHDYRNVESHAHSMIMESIQNRIVVKINCAYSFMCSKVEGILRSIETVVGRRSRYSMRMNVAMMMGFSICYLLAFGWGVVDLSHGVITVGEFAAIIQLVDNIQSPAQSIAGKLPNFSNYWVAASRIAEIEQLEDETITTLPLDARVGLRLDDVSFSYSTDSGTTVIEHFSHDFKPGSCTIIKGETGKGKTTLLKLMLALVAPTEGRLWAYDSSGACFGLSSGIREHVEYVPQGNTMLSGSVADNLRIGNPNAAEDEMKRALEIACAEFVFNQRNGLATMCSEKGGSISEGQAQRIVIARALLRDKPVLILDESTSALDEKTENRLISNLKSLEGKTVIFVTHKGNMDAMADEIIHL